MQGSINKALCSVAVIATFLVLIETANSQPNIQLPSCPSTCRCSKNLKIVSCMNQKLTTIPENIPVTATELLLGNNLLTSVPTNAFVNLTNLERLSLKNNIITTVKQKAFTGLASLKKLYLTSNKIKSEELPSEVFADLMKLERLYLTQNLLTVIPDLPNQKALKQLGFDFNRIDNISFPAGFGALKNITNIDLAHNPLKAISQGDLVNLKNSSIAKFDLASCNLQTVDPNSFSAFTSLQSLTLSYNKDLTVESISNIIKSIKSNRLGSLDLSGSISDPKLPVDIFEPFSGVPLNNLQMRHTEILEIFNGTFSPLHRLLHLDMSYSKLAVISDNVFLPLKKLVTLDISYCSLQKFPVGLPSSATKINLSRNKPITTLPPGLFQTGSKVQTIDLSFCSLTHILTRALDGLSALNQLNMSNNQLSGNSIPTSLFKSCVQMRVLDLSHNKVIQITTESTVFAGLENLISLDFSWNQCSKLPFEVFQPLKGLQRLDLNNNNLGTLIGNDAKGVLFQNLASLKWLSLASNNLQHIPNNTFTNLKNLTQLFLDGNQITSWDTGAFYSVSGLEYLDLTNNLISTPTVAMFKYFKAGQQIDLSHNPLNCWCDLIPFREWFDKSTVLFVNNQSYMCGSPKEMQGKPFIDFNPSSIAAKCHPPILKYALYGGAGGGVVILILGIVVYIYRWKILLQLYYLKKSCTCKRQNGYNEIVNQYQCTLIYGPGEESTIWVKEQLYDKLTKEWKIPEDMIFMDEDSVPFGTGFMNELEKIHNAMTNSAYIIPVIDKEFMGSGKKKVELDMAQECAIETLEEGTKKIIPVYFEVEHSNAERLELMDKIPKTLHKDSISFERLIWNNDPANQELFWQKLQRFFNQGENRGNIQEA